MSREFAALAGDLRPAQLNELVVTGIIAKWRARLGQATIYGHVSYLRKLLRRFRDIGAPDLLRFVPRMRAATPRSVILQPGELDKLITAAPPYLQLFTYLCSHLALRFTEAYEACPAGYNAEAHTLRVRTKGGKVRTLPTTPEIDKLIAIAKGTGDPMRGYVSALHGSPITPYGVRCAWRRLVLSCGINPAINPHDLRRTTANLAYSLTKDLRAVQQLLGHSSIRATAWYMVGLAPEHLNDLFNQLRLPLPEKVQ